MERKAEAIAREARNEYARKWRAANPDKVREANLRYWVRRAEREAAQRKERPANKSQVEISKILLGKTGAPIQAASRFF